MALPPVCRQLGDESRSVEMSTCIVPVKLEVPGLQTSAILGSSSLYGLFWMDATLEGQTAMRRA